jgi:hypothetical protein
MRHFIGVTLKDLIWKGVLALNLKVESLVKTIINKDTRPWLRKAADKSIELLVKEYTSKDQKK